MAWHKGTWWPLYVKEWYSPRSSQHIFDPYSFCLLVLGLLFHLLWGTEDIDNWIFGFLVALGVQLVLEVVGNTQFVIKRIRTNSGTQGEYIGDSIQNILGDLLSLSLGYILSSIFAAVELWWVSIVWALLSELICLVYMRDSLLMMIITLMVNSDRLKNWQVAKLPKSESQQYFMSRLWRTNKKSL